MSSTTNAQVDKIDHYQKGIDRLLHQYDNKPVIEGLLKGLLEGNNNIEDLLSDFLEEMALDNATGANLDLFGAMFNVSRRGLSDQAYRELIFATIYSQNSDSTPDSILNAFSVTVDSDDVAIFEVYHHGTPPPVGLETGVAANFILRGQVEDLGTVPSSTQELMQVASPAGVGKVEIALTDNDYFFQPSEVVITGGTVLQRSDGDPQGGTLEFDDTLGDTGNILYSEFGDLEGEDTALLAEISENNFLLVTTQSWVYASGNEPSGLSDGSTTLATNTDDWSEVVVGATVEINFWDGVQANRVYGDVQTVSPTANGWTMTLSSGLFVSGKGSFLSMLISQLDEPTNQTGWINGLGKQQLEVSTNSTIQQLEMSTTAGSSELTQDGVMLEILNG